MNVNFDKFYKIAHVDLRTQHREQLLIVRRDRYVRLVIHTVVHFSRAFIVVYTPLMEYELLEKQEQQESEKVLLPGIVSWTSPFLLFVFRLLLLTLLSLIIQRHVINLLLASLLLFLLLAVT